MDSNGYQLSRRWYDWCFQYTGHHTPAHGALYSWFVEACNRLNWPDAFEMAPQYAMSAIGIRSYNTYKDTLSDLQAWGLVRIRQKGASQYTPWLLALSNFDEPLNNPRDKANDSAVSNFDIPLNKARNKASDEACNNPRDAYTKNNKPKTLNPKPETKESDADASDFDAFDEEHFSKQKKERAPTPVPAAPSPAVPDKPPKIIDHLFRDSPYYNRQIFIETLTGTDYDIYDLTYYHETIKNWADSKTTAQHRKSDWIATAKGFMLRDAKKGEAKLRNDIQPINGNAAQTQNGVGHRNGKPASGSAYVFDLNAELAKRNPGYAGWTGGSDSDVETVD